MTFEEFWKDYTSDFDWPDYGPDGAARAAFEAGKAAAAEGVEAYTVEFQAKEALEIRGGSIVTAEGEIFWPTIDASGWCPYGVTGARFEEGELLPPDLKTWETAAEAEKFAIDWPGHPWYHLPKAFRVVKVQQKLRSSPAGWEG
jgi:hypothetical protein